MRSSTIMLSLIITASCFAQEPSNPTSQQSSVQYGFGLYAFQPASNSYISYQQNLLGSFQIQFGSKDSTNCTRAKLDIVIETPNKEVSVLSPFEKSVTASHKSMVSLGFQWLPGFYAKGDKGLFGILGLEAAYLNDRYTVTWDGFREEQLTDNGAGLGLSAGLGYRFNRHFSLELQSVFLLTNNTTYVGNSNYYTIGVSSKF